MSQNDLKLTAPEPGSRPVRIVAVQLFSSFAVWGREKQPGDYIGIDDDH
ncbi:hypothetical protein [Marispirochaeta aestuarii]|nr:hypothetical protein [Marispirochaeta aestuarii]